MAGCPPKKEGKAIKVDGRGCLVIAPTFPRSFLDARHLSTTAFLQFSLGYLHFYSSESFVGKRISIIFGSLKWGNDVQTSGLLLGKKLPEEKSLSLSESKTNSLAQDLLTTMTGKCPFFDK